VCQTITAIDTRSFTVDTLAVSLQKTTLGSMTSGTAVNLERAMRLSDRIGGHLVQGHVDGTARIKSIRRQGMNTTLTVVVPAPLMKYCVPEGSIALDGVSLTIAQIQGAQLMCSIIPHTWEHVALKYKRPGEQVHCEVDMIARHLERLMQTVHHTGG
jgi:riboflavin synthase